MHRSVLENKIYGKYARDNTVEVISMEELDKAVAEESRHIRTYQDQDQYGDDVARLVEFPGLTIDQLEGLSNSDALNYMQGNRIPYTAIVDPHTLKEMEGLRGVRQAKELIEVIERHRKALEAAHGKGLDRKLWRKLTEGIVQIDVQLGAGEIVKALAVHRELSRMAVRQPEVVQRRLRHAQQVILDDAGKRLEELEKKPDVGEARALARALEGTPLEERARALLKKDK
jgi:hypothetical protein